MPCVIAWPDSSRSKAIPLLSRAHIDVAKDLNSNNKRNHKADFFLLKANESSEYGEKESPSISPTTTTITKKSSSPSALRQITIPNLLRPWNAIRYQFLHHLFSFTSNTQYMRTHSDTASYFLADTLLGLVGLRLKPIFLEGNLFTWHITFHLRRVMGWETMFLIAPNNHLLATLRL